MDMDVHHENKQVAAQFHLKRLGLEDHHWCMVAVSYHVEGHSMNLYTAPTFNYSAKVQQHGHLPKETRERCKGIAYVQGRAGWGGDPGGREGWYLTISTAQTDALCPPSSHGLLPRRQMPLELNPQGHKQRQVGQLQAWGLVTARVPASSTKSLMPSALAAYI